MSSINISIETGLESELERIMEKRFPSGLEIFIGQEKAILFASAEKMNQIEQFMYKGIVVEIEKAKRGEATVLTLEEMEFLLSNV